MDSFCRQRPPTTKPTGGHAAVRRRTTAPAAGGHCAHVYTSATAWPDVLPEANATELHVPAPRYLRLPHRLYSASLHITFWSAFPLLAARAWIGAGTALVLACITLAAGTYWLLCEAYLMHFAIRRAAWKRSNPGGAYVEYRAWQDARELAAHPTCGRWWLVSLRRSY